MLEFTYKDLLIRLEVDNNFSADSAGNNYAYSQVYIGSDEDVFVTRNYGIKVMRGEHIIADCILMATGGATTLCENSALLDGDRLLVCCCDTLFCMELPTLQLVWQLKADWATAFQVFKLQDNYLVHGECEISRVARDGTFIWQFGGADIFVSLNGEEVISLGDDHIRLRDINSVSYIVDFNGNVIK